MILDGHGSSGGHSGGRGNGRCDGGVTGGGTLTGGPTGAAITVVLNTVSIMADTNSMAIKLFFISLFHSFVNLLLISKPSNCTREIIKLTSIQSLFEWNGVRRRVNYMLKSWCKHVLWRCT